MEMNRRLFDPEHLRIAAGVRAKAWRRRWLGFAFSLAAKNWHHPVDLISGSTNLQAFGGWKFMQMSQRCCPLG
jgi:hypothetical protein